MRAQLLDTVADSFANTEAPKEPVIRVSSAVVDGAAVTTMIVAVAARRCGRSLGHILRLGRPGREAVGRHLDWTGGVLAQV